MKTYLFSLALTLISSFAFGQQKEIAQTVQEEAFTKMPEGPKYSDPPRSLGQAASSLESILPYPNPGNGRFYLDLLPGQNYQLQVLDLAGTVRYHQKINGHGASPYLVSLGALPKGIYLVKLNDQSYKYQKL